VTEGAESVTAAEVIPIRPAAVNKKVSEEKWGKPVMDLGFSIIPSLLLRAQARLGLNPTQLAVLLHLADYWWDVERKPYPSKQRLADRLKLGPRQVQRYIAELETAGFVQRIERRAPHKGKISNEYDLTGLVDKLAELAPEFRKVEDQVKTSRRTVERPGVRRRRSSA
jgi:predicted transcriptional regulator